MKKIGKIILWITVGFLLLDFTVVGLLFIPSIQTFIVEKVTESISEKWGTELSMKDVRITPTLRLVAHELRIQDNHHNDMIFVGTVNGRLRSITLKPFRLKLGNVTLQDANVVLRKYDGDAAVNISIWAEKFKKKDKPKSSFFLSAKHLTMLDSRVVIINDYQRTVFDTEHHPPMDYGYLELKDIDWEVDRFVVSSKDITSISAKFRELAFSQYSGFRMRHGEGDFNICDTALVFNQFKGTTDHSKLDMDLQFRYAGWENLSEFVDSVRIIANIRPSLLDMEDIADFVGSLRGMDEKLFLDLDRFDGTLNDFRIIDLNARCGFKNRIHGDLALRNITHPKDAYLNIQLDSCRANIPELSLLSLPGGKKINLGKTVPKLGQSNFDLSFVGTLTDFNATLDANTEMGDVAADISSLVDEGTMQLSVSANTPNINLAKLTGANKALGIGDFDLVFDGTLDHAVWDKENFKTLQGHLNASVNRIDILGYPLKNTLIDGDYKDLLYNATVTANDPHLNCDIIAQFDLTENDPILQGNIELDHFDLGAVANAMPRIDSTTAKGFDKVIYTLQQNPSLKVGFDNFMVALRGHNIEDVSGYLGCDNIRISNGKDSLSDGRFRITSIYTEVAHKFIVSSNIANLSMETNYPLRHTVDTVRHLLHQYVPTLLADVPISKNIVEDRNGYIKMKVSTYRANNVFKALLPNIYIAPNSTADITLRSNAQDDHIDIDVPFFSMINKIAVEGLILHGTGNNHNLALNMSSKSVLTGKYGEGIPFDNIQFQATSDQQAIHYDLEWHNDFNQDPSHRSKLSGSANIASTDDIILNFRHSRLYLNDAGWEFNDDNSIHFKKHHIAVQNLTIANDSSVVSVNGDYATEGDSKLNLKVSSFDMSILNPLLSKMTCGGSLNADVNLLNGDRRLVLGKVLANNFVFNDVSIGDLFVIAGWNTQGEIGFSGGFFNHEKIISASELTDYDIRRFQREPSILARLNGSYSNESKELIVNTQFDTLNAGFLAPFLSGFSDHLTGTASGNLAFHSTPKASYIDGLVQVIDADMGIAALGTNYHVKDQNIRFNSRGIFFDDMLLTDELGNHAHMHGEILHNLFKDMRFNLNIQTDGITVLNTPKSINSAFYGTGIASGEVSITGTDDYLYFKGPNLYTLSGTKIYLQVSSANSASESSIIHFKSNRLSEESSEAESTDKSKTQLDFDFTFNVTDDADIVLFLESIGGTMNARANGNFRLTYNDNDDLNLYGNLELHSGDFKFSLYNIVNSRFTLVPGGSIIFDGPLDDMVVHASAYKSSKTSLANVVPQEYLVNNAANTVVNAYLHLNGEIMQQIDPTFSFELPNSSNEIKSIFYNSIDTTNKENLTKQFAYFMITNNFMPSSLFSNSTGVGNNYNMLSNLVNNMLSNLMDSRNGSFGIVYNQATETTSAEYGIQANANILKDRISMSTSIGYYDDRNADAANNMYGDFTVEYNINKARTWKLKAYTFIGEHDEDYYTPDRNSQINYTAGVALAYKQSFDAAYRRRIRNNGLTAREIRKRNKENEKQ